MKNFLQQTAIKYLAVIFLGFGIFGFSGQAAAQIGEPMPTLDFEEEGVGADWSWMTFENADNPPLEFIANPDPSGINTSETVAAFTARADGAPWAGTRGTGNKTFLFSEDNRTITVMVWKSVISDFGVKLETASNWAEPEVVVSNTVVNQWEAIEIDFTGRAFPPEGESFNGISVFPDFREGREEDMVVYFDNISFEGFEITGENDNGGGELETPDVAAPAPTLNPDNVISIYSDAFDSIEEVNFNPNWGQATQVSFMEIDGSNTMVYANFNYQGTEFTNHIDASAMTHIRFDMWTPDAEAVNFTIISPGPEEKLFPLEITHGEWVSYEISLDYFDNVDITDIFQLKFDGGTGSSNLFLDNIIIYDADATSIGAGDTRPVQFELSQNYPNPFNPTTQIQYTMPESGHVKLEVYNMMGQRVATLVNESVNAGSHTVSFDASDLASGIYLYRLQAGNTAMTKKMTLIK